MRIGGQFFSKFLGKGKPIYVPNPTWGNHIPIMQDSGLVVEKYRYLDSKVGIYISILCALLVVHAHPHYHHHITISFTFSREQDLTFQE